jgi:hypothetical protein
MVLRPVLVAVLVAASGAAFAQTPEEESAKTHFKVGTDYYVSARYEEALKEFMEAYRLRPLPKLQFNIGECLERLGRLKEAVAALQVYLKETPNAEDRRDVERRIATFEERIKKEEETKPPPTVTPPPEKPKVEVAPPPPQVIVIEKPVVAPTVETQQSPSALGTSVTFVAKDEDMHYAVRVKIGQNAEVVCVTPCSLKLPPGQASVSVGRGERIFFTRPFEVPSHAALVRLAHRCTECYVAGGIVFAVGGLAGGLALGLGNYNAPDLGTKIPSIVVPVAGGILALVGLFLVIGGGSNSIDVVDRVSSQAPLRLTSLGLSPTRDGGWLGASFSF